MEHTTAITAKLEDITPERARRVSEMPYNFQPVSPVKPPSTGVRFQLTMRALWDSETHVPPQVQAIIEQVAAEQESGLRYLADK